MCAKLQIIIVKLLRNEIKVVTLHRSFGKPESI